MTRRRKSVAAKVAATEYAVRVGDQRIVGFRYLPVSEDKKKKKADRPVLDSDERTVAPCCVARLGDQAPYRWDNETAARFIADAVGGAVEPIDAAGASR